MKRISMFGPLRCRRRRSCSARSARRPAGPPTPFKCTAAKIKCANGKATALLGCHNKAESKDAARRSGVHRQGRPEVHAAGEGLHGEGRGTAKPPCPTSATRDDREQGRRLRARRRDRARSRLSHAGPQQVLRRQEEVRRQQGEGDPRLLRQGGRQEPPRRSDTASRRRRTSSTAAPTRRRAASRSSRRRAATTASTTRDTAALEAKVDAFALDEFRRARRPPDVPRLHHRGRPRVELRHATRTGPTPSSRPSPAEGSNIGGGASIVPEGPTPDGSRRAGSA